MLRLFCGISPIIAGNKKKIVIFRVSGANKKVNKIGGYYITFERCKECEKKYIKNRDGSMKLVRSRTHGGVP